MQDWICDHAPTNDDLVQVLCRVLSDEVADPVRSCHLAISSGDHAEGDLFVSIGHYSEAGDGERAWFVAGWDMAQDCWMDARRYEVVGWQPTAAYGVQH